MYPTFQRDLALSEFSENAVASLLANEYGCSRQVEYGSNRQSQLNGIDIYTPYGACDDKMIASQLGTFSFEVGCLNYSPTYKGWFDPTKENIKTKVLNLSYWTVSKEAGGTGKYKEDKNLLVPFHIEDNKRVYEKNNLQNVESLETITLDRNKFMDAVKQYFKDNGLDLKTQIDAMKEKYQDSKSWMDMSSIDGKGNGKNDKMRFVISNQIAERPVNLVITKEFMEESGAIIDRKTYTKEEIENARNNVRKLNDKSDILVRNEMSEEEMPALCDMRLWETMQNKILEVEKQEKDYFKAHKLTKSDIEAFYDRQDLHNMNNCKSPDEYLEFNELDYDNAGGYIHPIDYLSELNDLAETFISNYVLPEDMFEDNPVFAETAKNVLNEYIEEVGEIPEAYKDYFSCLENVEEMELC